MIATANWIVKLQDVQLLELEENKVALVLQSCPGPPARGDCVEATRRHLLQELQPAKGFVDGKKLLGRSTTYKIEFLEINSRPVFSSRLAPSILDQGPPHGLCCRPKEVTPAVPVLNLLDIHEPHVSFMH